MIEYRPVLLVSQLHPGQEIAYERAHRVVPRDLRLALEHAGVRDWTIWRCGLELLHVIDVDDYDAMTAELNSDLANVRWQEAMRAFVSGFIDTRGFERFDNLSLVWSLCRQQREEGAD